MSYLLHSYWRATAPYRVRIGLALKGVAYDYAGVHLLEGVQHSESYKAVNRQGLVPSLTTPDGQVLTQSLAILEWLEETHPEPALLPKAAGERAVVRAMATLIACDIHPLNNVRVQRQLSQLGVDQEHRDVWSRRWIDDGFTALEPMVAAHGQGFAFGSAPTLADCCLIPQVYSAARFNVDMTPYPAIAAVAERAAQHPAFVAAHPDNQPDAQPG